jgi:hypothetical protein
MTETRTADTARDEHDIAQLLVRWGHARDSDDWDTLADCFHDDATIHISWISGAAVDFIAGSKAMAAKRPPGAHIKHIFAGPWIRVNGDRAFGRIHATLHARAAIDGCEFDFLSLFRFFDLLERRDGVWRIVKRAGVYEKDRMDPVDTRGVPTSFYADLDLSRFAPETRFLSYRQSRLGTPSVKVATVYSAEEAALKKEGENWLAGG